MAVAPRVTIREIADRAGVSIATVSRVLNGREDVAPETRTVVQRVIQENGYTANRSARGLSGGRTGLVGVLVPLVFPAYFAGLLAGAAEALRGARPPDRALAHPGTSTSARSPCSTGSTGSPTARSSSTPEESTWELERLLDRGYRFVVLDPLMTLDERIPVRLRSATHRAPTRRCATCSSSATGGSRRSPDRPAGSRPRAAAAATAPALASAGILPDPALEVEAIPEFEPGRKAAEKLLDLADPPTAIFAFNDNIAIGAIQAARARGLRVPEDLSVVGFDDVEYATIVTPALTTVRQPLAEMGRTAVSLLEPAARGSALRDAARRAGDAPRRPRLHRSAAKSGRVVIP